MILLNYLPEFFTVILLHLLAVMAPGPDFAIITRNSLVYSKKVGVYSALGVALGIIIHVTYSLIGIGLIISKSILLFSTIKLLGAAYLIYIGYKSLKAKKIIHTQTETITHKKDLTPFQAINIGFLSNVLNPKTTLFFLSLFTQVIAPETPLLIQLIYGIEMVIMTFVWFAFLASILSHGLVKKKFSSIHHYLEKIMGALLIALGIKVAISNSK